jgi:hypothetical protein
MKKSLFILALAFASACANDSSRVYKNMLGWDDGIAYRRCFSKDIFAGISFMGGINKNDRYQYGHSVYYRPDTQIVSSSTNVDTSIYYNARMTLLLGKTIIKEKWLYVNFFIFPYFTNYWSHGIARSQSSSRSWDYEIGSSLGFEPSFTLFKRFVFGSKFGVECSYQRNGNNSTGNSSYSSYDDKSDSHSYRFSIFGTNFSTNLSLFGYYRF